MAVDADAAAPELTARPLIRCRVAAVFVTPMIIAGLGAPSAQADSVAYLVNVTVRPGYNFANADAALAYGYGICDNVAQNQPYSTLLTTIHTDFAASDEYQAQYLVNQAVNELCPAQIWQLRSSAAHYRPVPPPN